MELAIVGLIGLLGYAASATGKQPRTLPLDEDTPTHPQAYPFGPGTAAQEAMDADRARMQAQWEQSMQPHATGVITPNTPLGSALPFFTSEKTQGTNSMVKQRLMEMYTGAVDADSSQSGTYRHKAEAPRFFDPALSAVRVTSGGSGGSMSAGGPSTTQRYIPSQLQQNVLPTQHIRVGPGVGVDASVPATDGFHPMLRVLPQDFGWKKNNLNGTVVPGGALIASQPNVTFEVTDKHPPRYWTMEEHPPGPGRAVLTGPTARSQDPGTGCNGHARLVGSDYYGNAFDGGSYVPATGATRDRHDNNPGLPETNVSGARDGVGGFVNAAYDTTRLQGQRETSHTFNGVATGSRASYAQEGYLLPNTQRDMQNAARTGNPGTAVEGGQARPMDRSDRTLREQMAGPAQPGMASPYIKGARVTGTDKWLDRESKRYGQIIQGWLPPPCLASSTPRRFQYMANRQRVEMPPGSALPTTYTPSALTPMGMTTSANNKLPVDNPRLDLALAQNQLATNEFAQTITGRQRA